VLGIALDGVGLGTDGGAWGGELLHVAGAHCARIGRLRTLPLPGGDRAAREPWRMAASALHLLGRGREIASRFPGPVARPVQEMLERGVRTPPTSSAGRWFDAAAGLLGIKPVAAFEGQAAMLLEGLAERHGPVAALEGAEDLVQPDGTLDLLPVLARLAEEKDAGYGAALFHASFAEALAQWATRAAQDRAVESVVLGGGCFLNRVLSTALRGHLRRRGFSVYEASQLPPNDGGLSLGQAWVARAAMRADAQTISAPTTVRMTSCV
jgi:hydrogenase maturation protein HypF